MASPDLSRPLPQLAAALAAWEGALGAENVVVDAATLASAGTATFATTSRVPALLRVGSTAEVQAVLRIANELRVPVYPVSRGRNWGYGSRVPPADGCAILDLGRMNRILDFDEELASMTVEPGVSFQQGYEFLRERRSGLLLSVTGGPPEGSMVGNAVERGIGGGPYGDRFASACALEVVLPTGALLHTGYDRFPGASAARLHRWGVGPHLDGLFSQSNLGVVTRMSFYLARMPREFHVIELSIRDEDRLPALVDRMRGALLDGLVRGSMSLWNDYKLLSVREGSYPWEAVGGATPLSPSFVRERLSKAQAGCWLGIISLYSASRAEARARLHLIRERFGPVCDRIVVSSLHPTLGDRLRGQLDRLRGNRPLRRAPADSPSLGVPQRDTVRSAYWRKRAPAPASPDLDRDRCGAYWCSPSVPLQGTHIRAATSIIRDVCLGHGFEPNVAIICDRSDRTASVVAALLYDRDVPGEDERARACYRALYDRLAASGYYPYRLSIESMGYLPRSRDDYGAVLESLKRALDPNDILAPGRYDFRQDWPTGPA